MKTSNFELSGTLPNSVAISRGIPKGYTGKRCILLAPPWNLVRESDPEIFTQIYEDTILSKLDPAEIYHQLGEDAVLLCWERPGVFCHRRLVARWLETALGIVVPELEMQLSIQLECS